MSDRQHDEDGAYDAAGLARRLGVSAKWVRTHTWRIAGRMQLSKRCVRYDREQVERAIVLHGTPLKAGT